MTKEDFDRALAEVKPAFGAVTETLEEYRLNGIISYGAPFKHLLDTCNTLVEQARHSSGHAVSDIRGVPFTYLHCSTWGGMLGPQQGQRLRCCSLMRLDEGLTCGKLFHVILKRFCFCP